VWSGEAGENLPADDESATLLHSSDPFNGQLQEVPAFLSRRPWLAYVLALAAVGVAFALRWLFEPWLHGQLPFVTIFGAVALSVWMGGTRPAILAAATGFVASGPWLLGGRNPFELFDAGFLIALVGYTVSCGFIVGLGEILRNTRRDLIESEEHYRQTTELNPQVTWTARPDGLLDRVSERWAQWTGSSGLGDSWSQGLHPQDLGDSVAAWTRAVKTGQPLDVEYRVRLVDGEFRWMRSRAFARYEVDDSGARRIVKWYGTTEDVHERKLAQARLTELNATLEEQVASRTAALRSSEARMRTVFSTSYQYQALLDVRGQLLDANATSLSGIRAELADVIGRPFWETPWFSATPSMAEAVKAGVGAAAQGQSQREEIAVNLPDERRRFDFAMRPVFDAGGSVVAIVAEAIDITERHLAEEKLRQAQKMEAIGQLTGGVAHDFNNLLQVISANLHLIGKYVPGHEKVTERVASALGAVKRGAKLANQLLAFGRRQALEPRVINVGRFLVGMEDMLRRSIGEAIDIETVVTAGLWNTFVDPTQLETALLNLAINARDSMNGGGRLTIEVGNAFLDDLYTRRHADVNPGQYVMLAVSDTGSGMPQEVAARAFEPFFSTKPAGSGTGLGLSMVYGFVKQSGGHVKIYSEVGHGTTIKMYLPRTLKTEEPAKSPEPPGASAGASTILVVEDDEGARETTVVMLQELGYHVLKARDAASALTVVEGGAAVDLLFTDVVTPGPLPSAELARRARERLPLIGVLFTSGHTQNAIVHGGRLDEGVQLLAKPYTQAALASRIASMLEANGRPSAPPLSASAQAPVCLMVLVVEDNDLVRDSTAEMVRGLSHEVLVAASAEAAMQLLHAHPVDVLMTDVDLPGISGDVFAAEARTVRPDLRIVFATGGDRVPGISNDTGAPVLLRKPYDSVGIEAALKAAIG
jgi:PAS domain S-box-containing protein